MPTDTFSQEANASGSSTVTLNPNSVKAIDDGGDYIAFAFDSVTIAQGSTVSEAILTVDVHDASDDAEIVVGCDDSDDAAALAATSGNISGRTVTTATTTVTGVDGSQTLEINITASLQEVVNRGGFASGNRVVVILEGQPDDRDNFEIDLSTAGSLEVTHAAAGTPVLQEVTTFTSPTTAGTVDVTWDQAIWDGETPAAIMVTSIQRDSYNIHNNCSLMVGMATPTESHVCSIAADNDQTTTDTERNSVAQIVYLIAGNGAVVEQATITVWNATKITFNFTTVHADENIYTLTAIGCEDAKLCQVSAPSTATTKAETGVGFEPDALIGMSIGHVSNPAVDYGQVLLALGVATPTAQQTLAISSKAAEATSITDSVFRSGFLHMHINGSDWLTIDVDSFDASGFTLDYTATSAGRLSTVLALKGVGAKIIVGNQPTTDTTEDRAVGFAPKGAIGLSAMMPTSTAIEADMRAGIGSWDASNSQVCVGVMDEDDQSTTDTDRLIRDTMALQYYDHAQAVKGSCVLSASGTTLTETWTDTDGTQREHVWFVLGDAPPDEGAAALMMLL